MKLLYRGGIIVLVCASIASMYAAQPPQPRATEQKLNQLKKNIVINLSTIYLETLKAENVNTPSNPNNSFILESSRNFQLFSNTDPNSIVTTLPTYLQSLPRHQTTNQQFVPIYPLLQKSFEKLIDYVVTKSENKSDFIDTIVPLAKTIRTTKNTAIINALDKTIESIQELLNYIQKEAATLSSKLIETKNQLLQSKKGILEKVTNLIQSKWVIAGIATYILGKTAIKSLQTTTELVAMTPELYKKLELPLGGFLYFINIEKSGAERNIILSYTLFKKMLKDNFFWNLAYITSPYSVPYLAKGAWNKLKKMVVGTSQQPQQQPAPRTNQPQQQQRNP